MLTLGLLIPGAHAQHEPKSGLQPALHLTLPVAPAGFDSLLKTHQSPEWCFSPACQGDQPLISNENAAGLSSLMAVVGLLGIQRTATKVPPSYEPLVIEGFGKMLFSLAQFHLARWSFLSSPPFSQAASERGIGTLPDPEWPSDPASWLELPKTENTDIDPAPSAILVGNEYEQQWLYLDHEGRLRTKYNEYRDSITDEPLAWQNLRLAWRDSESSSFEADFDTGINDGHDAEYDPFLQLLTQLASKPGAMVIRCIRQGGVVYVYMDHQGRQRQVSRETLQQWFSLYHEQQMEKVVFGEGLPAGGGEAPEAWQRKHRTVPEHLLRLLNRLATDNNEGIPHLRQLPEGIIGGHSLRLRKNSAAETDSNIENEANGKQKPSPELADAGLDPLRSNRVKKELINPGDYKHQWNNAAPVFEAAAGLSLESLHISKEIKASFWFSDRSYGTIPRNDILKQIKEYLALGREKRKAYLEERMEDAVYHGSDFPALAGQSEVRSARDIEQFEVLGHYAGVVHNEQTMSVLQEQFGDITVSKYLAFTRHKLCISGFQKGNILSLINANHVYRSSLDPQHPDYSEEETSKNVNENVVLLPVSYEGQVYTFAVSVREIKQGQSLWLDYGEKYWQGQFPFIDLTDCEAVVDDDSGVKRSPRKKRRHQCEKCLKCFTRSGHLQAHLLIHAGERPYECEHCKQCFRQSGTLLNHLKIHNGKTCRCENCGKGFTRPDALQAHRRTHTGERPYECKYCNQRFTRPSTLLYHLNLHTGNKPYKCESCGKGFSQSGTLQKHLRTHSGEKPYKCAICGQCFSQSGSKLRHQRSCIRRKSCPLTTDQKRRMTPLSIKPRQELRSRGTQRNSGAAGESTLYGD